jgi:hypothetical protein
MEYTRSEEFYTEVAEKAYLGPGNTATILGLKNRRKFSQISSLLTILFVINFMLKIVNYIFRFDEEDEPRRSSDFRVPL